MGYFAKGRNYARIYIQKDSNGNQDIVGILEDND